MKVLILGFVALVFFCTASAQNTTDNSDLKKKIESLELAHAKAILMGDTSAIDSITDENIVINHPTNRIFAKKRGLRDLIKNHVIQYASFERHPEEFFFYNNMVVVMGNETVVPDKDLPNAGKKINRRYTDVWVMKNNKWLLSVRHANNICE